MYWDLPNFDEAKFYYFHATDIGDRGSNAGSPFPLVVDSMDDVISGHYGWRWDEKRHQLLYRTFGTFSLFSFALAALAHTLP